MPLKDMAPPQRQREPKYKYTDDECKQAFKMLADGGSPADGPFDTQGQARSASNVLLRRLEEVDKAKGEQIGARVWNNSDQKDGNEWYFALKQGRKQGGGRPASS